MVADGVPKLPVAEAFESAVSMLELEPAINTQPELSSLRARSLTAPATLPERVNCDQLVRLLELRQNGITVKVVQGYLMKEAYEADGRKSIGGRGLLHAKGLFIEDFLLLGSSNWLSLIHI